MKSHVAYTYLLNSCLKQDERTGLYICPSRVWKLVVMHEMEKVFDYDLRGVPGFYYDVYRTDAGGGWMLNTPETGFLNPVTDSRAKVGALVVMRHALDARPKTLTSKGLPLGS